MSRENYGMMNQEIQDDEVTIDLMELFSALWAKKTIIILSAVFMALVAFVGTKMFVTPKYTSVTKLFVMAKNDDTSASATYTDLQTGSMLTKDYMELVKSRPVLEKTISKLKLDVTPEELAGMITTETPTDTRIMSISVTDDDPKEAKTDRRHTQKSSQRTDQRDHECGFCQHCRRREPSDQPVFPECQEEHDARRTARTCHLYGINCTDLYLR